MTTTRKRDTDPTNMAVKMPTVVRAYRYTKRLHDGEVRTIVRLHSCNCIAYLPTPFVDEHIPTRQPNAPMHEIRDMHAVVEYRDGSWVGW